MLKELLQKNWGQLILLSILLKLSLSPSSICLKYIFQLNWNSWLKSYIKHGNKFIILYQVLIVSRDRGKPIRDPTGLICFFCNKMDSVLKMSLSIEYHTKSDPPLVRYFIRANHFLKFKTPHLTWLHLMFRFCCNQIPVAWGLIPV